VGYQPASQYTNYNATILYHLAEALHTSNAPIAPVATPAEKGTYVQDTDPAFGSVVLASGGTQILLNRCGDVVPKYGNYWMTPGVVRISQSSWDNRLGPIDGCFDGQRGHGVSFAPTWQRGGKWFTLADMSQHYRGHLSSKTDNDTGCAECSILYEPVTDIGGPTFRMHVGVDAGQVTRKISSPSESKFGVIIPCIVENGRDQFETFVERAVVETLSTTTGDARRVSIRTVEPMIVGSTA